MQKKYNDENQSLNQSYFRVLNNFLNLNYANTFAKLCFPFYKNFKIHNSANDDLNLICDTLKISSIPSSNVELAKTLILISQKLEKTEFIESKIKHINKHIDQIDLLKITQKKRKVVEEIFEFKNKKLINLIESLFIFGSYATYDYSENISDLDLIIQLDLSNYDYKKLLKLQKENVRLIRLTLKIDLFQHHGPYFISQWFMNNYDDGVLNSILFDYSVSDKKKVVRLRQIVPKNLEQIHKITLEKTIEAICSFPNGRLKYTHDAKIFFQLTQLLPIAYFQALNKSVYKKYSFDLFKKNFKEYTLVYGFIQKLRKEWRQPSSYYNFYIFLLFSVRHKLFKVDKETLDNLLKLKKIHKKFFVNSDIRNIY